jgi:hypothetical protein
MNRIVPEYENYNGDTVTRIICMWQRNSIILMIFESQALKLHMNGDTRHLTDVRQLHQSSLLNNAMRPIYVIILQKTVELTTNTSHRVKSTVPWLVPVRLNLKLQRLTSKRSQRSQKVELTSVFCTLRDLSTLLW